MLQRNSELDEPAKEISSAIGRIPLLRTVWMLARKSRSVRRLVEIGLKRPAAPMSTPSSSVRDKPKSFADFMAGRAACLDESLPELRRHITLMPYQPTFAVVIDGDHPTKAARTLASLEDQIWPKWRSRTCASAWPMQPAVCGGADFLMVVRAGDVLARDALYMFASTLNWGTDLDIIYTDEDCLDRDGRHVDPFFKPAWSPDTLESFDYIGYAACYRLGTAHPFVSAASLYDFLLRVTEATDQIGHISSVLYHCDEARGPIEEAAGITALQGRLRRTGRAGQVRRGPRADGYFDITLRFEKQSLISILIPTAGKVVSIDGREIDLLRHCVDSIQARSSWRNYEIIVIDNGDLDPARVASLEKAGCRFTTYKGAEINVAAKINFGARLARGDAVVILNDDIEVISPDWLERMNEHLAKPHVGVVGAKMLYPDRTIQHAGVICNLGEPEHVRRGYSADDAGYFYSTCAARNFLAVTGACMMSRRDVFLSVGGYDEDFPLSYNDTDYCLKLIEAGQTIVYAPRAELFHFETQSREPVITPTEGRNFQEKWAHRLASDPFYNNRHLSIGPPTFTPVCNARVL